MTLRAVVLGAAAGGGLPQWNCNGPNSARFWRGDGSLAPATQSSLAVSLDGSDWALINASPDLRAQIMARPVLHPRDPARFGLRDSPIRAVVLTNGDVDHVAGLLTLRERQAFTLWSTEEVATILAANPIFNVLDPALVTRRVVLPEAPFELLPGLVATLFAVPGKVPLYLEGETVETARLGGETVGVELSDGRARLFYIPGCARMTPALAGRLRDAALVLFDGTLFTDDEMIRQGVGTKTGGRMGHMAMSGPEGSIAAFAGLGVARKIFVHINNTNPVWRPESPERAEAEAAGWEIAFDGMELTP
ncbi:MAG TPA: pyrroloquinoline quinone biosynthesis protein PqqB [Paracoccaceae bacterium]|nr:pyrroloquinoline quinone biosynthesis protein PqqB [Paracoccaceae bacterium]